MIPRHFSEVLLLFPGLRGGVDGCLEDCRNV
jgi:hypothetical protein